MSKYHVSFMCIYSDVVEADSPEEAAKKVERDCEYDVDGEAHVVDIDTEEEWDI